MKWNFDPVFFSYGGLSIHWYGLIFSLVIFFGFYLSKIMFAYENHPQDKLDSLFYYVVTGVIVGARLGHCLFYDPQYYFSNPLKVIAIWEGGLASHGGGLGAILGIFLYSRKYHTSFIWLLDRIVIPTALFGVFVRFANFLNSEIVGAKSDYFWAVVFEKIDDVPRHPAQLYESIGYLIVFMVLLIAYSRIQLRERPGIILGLFLTLIFTIRFLVEYIKEPQASYTLGVNLNTGQILSVPFFIMGIVAILLACIGQKQGFNNTADR